MRPGGNGISQIRVPALPEAIVPRVKGRAGVVGAADAPRMARVICVFRALAEALLAQVTVIWYAPPTSVTLAVARMPACESVKFCPVWFGPIVTERVCGRKSNPALPGVSVNVPGALIGKGIGSIAARRGRQSHRNAVGDQGQADRVHHARISKEEILRGQMPGTGDGFANKRGQVPYRRGQIRVTGDHVRDGIASVWVFENDRRAIRVNQRELEVATKVMCDVDAHLDADNGSRRVNRQGHGDLCTRIGSKQIAAVGNGKIGVDCLRGQCRGACTRGGDSDAADGGAVLRGHMPADKVLGRRR